MINLGPYQPNVYPNSWLQSPTPIQPSAVPTQMFTQNIPSVNGLEEARNLNIGKNATTLMLDANQNVLYIKTTDGIGAVSNFAAFEMKQLNLDGTSETEDRMTRMENDIAEIKKLLSERRPTNGKHYSSNDGKQKQP